MDCVTRDQEVDRIWLAMYETVRALCAYCAGGVRGGRTLFSGCRGVDEWYRTWRQYKRETRGATALLKRVLGAMCRF
jgi:hypothetical protein